MARDSERVKLSPDWRAAAIARDNGSVAVLSLDFSDPAVAADTLSWRDYLLRLDLCESLRQKGTATELTALRCP
jgi:hypothetical protein